MNYAQMSELYIENLRRVRELSRAKPDTSGDDETILAQIRANSVQSYTLMRENNRLLQALISSRDPAQLSDEDIQDLSGFAGRLFNYSLSEDVGIAYHVYCLLRSAALARRDEALLIKEDYYCGISLHYTNDLEMPGVESPYGTQIRDYFNEGVSYLPQYENFDNEARQYIIRCLGNNKMRLPRTTTEECRYYYKVLDHALDVMRSPYYRGLNPEFPWDNYVVSMRMDGVTVLEYLRTSPEPAPEILQRVLSDAEYCYQERVLYRPFNALLRNWRVGYFYHAARYFAGKEPLRVLIEYLLEIVDRSDPNDYTAGGINVHLFLPAYLFCYRPLLPQQDERELCVRMDDLISGAMDYLGRIRAYHEPHVINESLQFLVSSAAAPQALSLKQVFNFLLVGHSPTYIHSLMVAALTERLVRRLLDVHPEAMLGVMGCSTVPQLWEKADKICALAYNCGLYHDIGKSMVLMYISDNARRPVDEEFTCIRQHPIYGYLLLCKLNREHDLAQAALYHHCFYNGKGGYPTDRGSCPADMKPIVDALSVADSLDAATDAIGRCYTVAKPYETLIEEVRAEQGTRYSPAVAALFDDEAFYNETKEILYSERNRTYVSVYRAAEKK